MVHFVAMLITEYDVSIMAEKAGNGDRRDIEKEERSMFIVPVAANY